jgi:hydrogenase expression/formation protein HypE
VGRGGTVVSGPERILLAHGSGGRLTRALVADLFLPAFGNAFLSTLSDSAILPELPKGKPALTTDAFVVDPPVFPGGDLGYLSVCGTVNDLAVAGARPAWLTFAVILEEGLPGELLETFVRGAAKAAGEAGVLIVAGDTKVVPRGKGDRMYAVTAGLGVVPEGRDLGDHKIRPGDAVLISGSLGDHGATIMASRHAIGGPGLASDCAPLAALAEVLLASGAEVHAMHDPTRGGVAATCNEVAGRTAMRIVLEESRLPIRPEVATISEMLGLDPLYLASEGRILVFVAAGDADRALEALRSNPLGRDAVRIGSVEETRERSVPVVLRTKVRGERPVDFLSGTDLPRIC